MIETPVKRPTGKQFGASLATDGAVLFAGRMLAFSLAFVTPLVLVRAFTVEEFGLYKQVFLIHATLFGILPFGIPAGLSYFVPRYPQARSAYILQTLYVLMLIALLGAGVVVASGSFIARTMGNASLTQLIPVLAVLLLFSISTASLEGLMIASKNSRLAAATHLASEIARSGLMIGAAVLMGNVLWVVLAAVISACFRWIALVTYLRHLGVTPLNRLNPARVREQFRYAFPFGLAVVLKTCAENLHFYVVAAWYNVAVFASYSVGFLQIPLVDIAFTSLADVALVRLAELKREGRLNDAHTVIGSSVMKLGLVLLPLYVWLLVNARDLVRVLYTDRFADSADIFMISLATIPLTVVSLEFVPRSFGDTIFIFRVNAARLVLTGILVIVLGSYLGPMWVAGGTVFALAITKGLILRWVGRAMAVPIGQLLPWGRLFGVGAISGAAGLLLLSAKRAMGLSPEMWIVVSPVPFVVICAVLAWKCGVLRPEEKTRIRDAVLAVGRVVGQYA